MGLKAHRVSLERTAARIEDTVKTEKGSLGVLAGLQSEQEQLLKRLELREQLLPPVSYAQIISAISQTIPGEVAVTEMVMKSVHPKPEPIETDAEREARLAGQTRKDKKTPEKTYEPHLVGIEMQGIAPDDLTVASLVQQLDRHPLFSRVTMRASRSVNTSQGLQAREFSLTATVDMDRKFIWSLEAEEVAHAD